MNRYNDDKTFVPVVTFALTCITLSLIAILFKIIMSI